VSAEDPLAASPGPTAPAAPEADAPRQRSRRVGLEDPHIDLRRRSGADFPYSNRGVDDQQHRKGANGDVRRPQSDQRNRQHCNGDADSKWCLIHRRHRRFRRAGGFEKHWDHHRDRQDC